MIHCTIIAQLIMNLWWLFSWFFEMFWYSLFVLLLLFWHCSVTQDRLPDFWTWTLVLWQPSRTIICENYLKAVIATFCQWRSLSGSVVSKRFIIFEFFIWFIKSFFLTYKVVTFKLVMDYLLYILGVTSKKNTSLAVLGALWHHLQRHTAWKIQNGR